MLAPVAEGAEVIEDVRASASWLRARPLAALHNDLAARKTIACEALWTTNDGVSQIAGTPFVHVAMNVRCVQEQPSKYVNSDHRLFALSFTNRA